MNRTLSALVFTAITAAPLSAAPLIYTTGHADLRPGEYDPETKAFTPGWHFDAGIFDEQYYAADQVVAIVSTTRTAPGGADEVLGTTGTVWVAGSSSFQPNLGFATGDLDPNDWEKINFGGEEYPAIMATLTGWSGPGQFGLYTTNVAGTTFSDVFFSTFDRDATDFDNTLEIIIPDHQHYVWGFTAPGTYELTITWWANHVTDGLIETEATYRFEVIPEPSSVVLLTVAAGLLTGAAGAEARRRRRMK